MNASAGAVVAMAAMITAAGAFAGPMQAQPGISVTGGGLAEACSDAAKRGEFGFRVEQLCTSALDTEGMLPLDRAGTYVNRGILKLRSLKYDQATEDFDTAIRYKADFPEAYVNRGAAHIGAHRFTESVADLNRALELGVKEPEKAYYNRALAFEWLDNPKAAYLDYRKALELAPDWDLVKQQLERFVVSHAELRPPGAPSKPQNTTQPPTKP